MKKLILEDSFGFPKTYLCEGQDIEVDFEHKGRKAVAIFEIEGGWELVSKSYLEPAEFEDLTINFLGASYADGEEEEIESSELGYQLIDFLEDQAVKKYKPVKPTADFEQD